MYHHTSWRLHTRGFGWNFPRYPTLAQVEQRHPMLDYSKVWIANPKMGEIDKNGDR